MTKIEWKVITVERQIADGFVFAIRYRVTATNGEKVSSFDNWVGFTRTKAPIVPFEQLKEEDFMRWIKALRNAQNIESTLTQLVEGP